MAQRNQQRTRPGTSQNGWLLTLVQSFEQAERLGGVRCDEEVLSEMRARLARPSMPHHRKAQFQTELQH